MIIVMKPQAEEAAILTVSKTIEQAGLEVHLSKGHEVTIIGVVGDKNILNRSVLCQLPQVEKIVDITETYKLANKKFHPEPTCVKVKNAFIGNGHTAIMAGPCSIENEDMMIRTAFAVKKAGATFLRGRRF